MRLIGLAVVLIVGLTPAPLAAKAQEAAKAGRVARVGLLGITSAKTAVLAEPFRRRLAERGWIEGKRIALEYR
jgi:hypothetical protein